MANLSAMANLLSRPRRLVLICAGTTCVGLGVLGALLPVLPTTPFMLLAAACYARASERLHRALLANRLFGPTIRAWQEDRSVPRAVKRKALVLVPLVFAASMWAVDAAVVRLLLALTGAALLLFLLRLPTR